MRVSRLEMRTGRAGSETLGTVARTVGTGARTVGTVRVLFLALALALALTAWAAQPAVAVPNCGALDSGSCAPEGRIVQCAAPYDQCLCAYGFWVCDYR